MNRFLFICLLVGVVAALQTEQAPKATRDIFRSRRGYGYGGGATVVETTVVEQVPPVFEQPPPPPPPPPRFGGGYGYGGGYGGGGGGYNRFGGSYWG
ncbi:unnamed protein product [Bursaphelenchus okinawaensis]|uniref:Uncharacterized protein n=1 Tax=Bursaphelenchus okinawaensis TaxID=465554 RepID=A0A811JPR5_9BILA|nr:unnamed protein product [Bursaphelenchus okinawaensis]CAG9076939.1 unnamed protein product [Bursaphelenchus okinawaensis]